MKRYIPKTKDDIHAVEYLKTCSFEVVNSDVSQLLIWLKDLHWDVSHGIAKYLIPHINQIKGDLLYILKSDDDEWKFNVLIILIRESPIRLDQELVLILERIADHPTEGEMREEVDEVAKSIIAKNKLL